MSNKKSIIHKAGLAVGLATFMISHANANPFQAEPLKTGYQNTGPVTPHSNVSPDEVPPRSTGPIVASDEDDSADFAPNIPEQNPEDATMPTETDKMTDGQCGSGH